MESRFLTAVRTSGFLTALSLLAACASGPAGPSSNGPFYGTITSRASLLFTTTAGPDSAPRMLVEDPPGVWSVTDSDCERAAYFSISGATRVIHQIGQPADTSWLTVGRKVAVRYGNVLQSCPIQTSATEVILIRPW